MAKLPTITLEDYLRRYLDNQAIKNEKLGFSEYGRKYHSDYKGRYNEAITRVLENERRAAMGTGAESERLSSLGLDRSGYADYIKSGLTPDLTAEREAAEEEYREERAKAESQYNKYEIAYDIEQKELREKVTEELVNNKVTNPANVYAYAIESGLSKENATALSVSITASTRDELKEKILDGLFNRTLSAASAKALARLYGIEGEELKALENMFDWYETNKTEIPDDFLEYLEKLSTYFNPSTEKVD